MSRLRGAWGSRHRVGLRPGSTGRGPVSLGPYARDCRLHCAEEPRLRGRVALEVLREARGFDLAMEGGKLLQRPVGAHSTPSHGEAHCTGAATLGATSAGFRTGRVSNQRLSPIGRCPPRSRSRRVAWPAEAWHREQAQVQLANCSSSVACDTSARCGGIGLPARRLTVVFDALSPPSSALRASSCRSPLVPLSTTCGRTCSESGRRPLPRS